MANEQTELDLAKVLKKVREHLKYEYILLERKKLWKVIGQILLIFMVLSLIEFAVMMRVVQDREIQRWKQQAFENAQAIETLRQSYEKGTCLPSLAYLLKLRALYFDVLDREPDMEGMFVYLNEIERGRTLSDIRQALAFSEEARNNLKETYRKMVQRDLDEAHYETYKKALAEGQSMRAIRESLLPKE